LHLARCHSSRQQPCPYDGISFNIPVTDPGYDGQTGAWTIILPRQLPDISSNLAIDGPGAARLIVKANADSNNPFRVFNVTATGTVSFSGITVTGGALPLSGAGGGIQNANSGTVNISNCVISGNFSLSGAGGVQNSSTGVLNVNGTTFMGNSSVTGGGALANANGTVTVINCVFNANSGAGNGSQGGGVYNATGKVTLMNNTFSGNSAGKGGAISEDQTAGVIIAANCTFSGNSSSNGGGGAISVTHGTINLNNCTVASNTTINSPSQGAGGIYCLSPAVINVNNTLIALNTATGFNVSPDVQGPFTSQGFNLVGKRDGSTGFTAATDQTGTSNVPLDPKLDPNGLQNHGGPTKTIALLFGSPAVDKGTAGNDPTSGMPLMTDQRGAGFSRTFNDPNIIDAGDGTDIGAFEVQSAAPPSPSPTSTATPTATPNLIEISTRMAVQTGDNVLFAGFIVSGNQPKKVIIRAIGPSLTNFGVQGALADPTLELFSGSTSLGSNDNWVDSPDKQAIIDSNVAPSDSRESAIVMSLPAGGASYTAILRGANNTPGIGVVEVYDLDSSADSILANISSRGFVQTGDNVMFAGVYVGGTSPLNVIIRAIGPSLSQFGVQGALGDPALELHDANATIIEANDNWVDSSNKQAILDSGIAPSNNMESAIVRTLSPGPPYTAIVRGVSNATGIAVVEIYALP
jgi:hypothetical protein